MSPSYAWEIDSFQIRAVIHEDSSAVISETLAVDFQGENRHGIYRDIPVDYTDRAGQHYRMRVSVLEVTDDQGRAWNYRLEKVGRYLRIRIGHPNLLVTGKKIYNIIYEVSRGAIRFFPDHDEFYWNLTGNEWAVPIHRAHAEIELPQAVKNVRAVGFQGLYGSVNPVREIKTEGNLVIVNPAPGLSPYEGVTVAVAWAKGVTKPPHILKSGFWWLTDNWIWGLPILVFGFMTWLWLVFGRDPVQQRSVTVEYQAPDDLRPAEMGALYDQQVDLKDITSTVIDLAVRGYIKIEPIENPFSFFGNQDYVLTSTKDWEKDPEIKPFENSLLIAIFKKPFEVKKLSDLKDHFYSRLDGIKSRIYKDLVKAGLFNSDPENIRLQFVFFGFLVPVLIYFLGKLFFQSVGQEKINLILSAGLCGLIIILYGRVMPRRTLKGAKATERVVGFVEFIKRTDADKIKRMADPKIFERCLPYALAFGLADRWARVFEGVYTQPPVWYGGRWDTFSARRFTRDLNHMNLSMGQTFVSQPRSSGSSGSWGGSGFGGGGFSGGGGGGGGGGSW